MGKKGVAWIASKGKSSKNRHSLDSDNFFLAHIVLQIVSSGEWNDLLYRRHDVFMFIQALTVMLARVMEREIYVCTGLQSAGARLYLSNVALLQSVSNANLHQ